MPVTWRTAAAASHVPVTVSRCSWLLGFLTNQRPPGHLSPFYVTVVCSDPYWPFGALLGARHPSGHSMPSYFHDGYLGRSAPFWPFIDFLATQRPPGHPASSRLSKPPGYSSVILQLTALQSSRPFGALWPRNDLLANRDSLGLSAHPSGCPPSQSGLENAYGRSWVCSLDPKQRRTEHMNIQCMPCPVEFATSKQSPDKQKITA